MSVNSVFYLAVGIGIVAGLRSLTAPAAVSWAVKLGWLNPHHSLLSLMGSTGAVALFSLGAIAEYVNDKLPKTPSRAAPPSLIARILMGGLSGACLCASAGESMITGALLAGVGSLIGTFGGYQARMRLTHGLKVRTTSIAVLEDLVAIGFAFFLVSRG